ncbi:hypothetical protein CH363_05000 [Leptospira haakeii]|uniref:Uncharacterized protein n=1 Tax=Leptospira haakeii TaxID=2023198 RepID=A0ABX4PQ89_9LEPT|nr:hypothetical protein CH363_05000 [Leptospira haakeii]PKA21707.1 hypothetical protein CH377_05000 [Leptospira haakeii]
MKFPEFTLWETSFVFSESKQKVEGHTFQGRVWKLFIFQKFPRILLLVGERLTRKYKPMEDGRNLPAQCTRQNIYSFY